MNRVTDCINKGLLVPFFWGGGGGKGVWGRASPEKCEISKPYNAIFVVLGTKLRTKEGVFIPTSSFHSIESYTINSYKQQTHDEKYIAYFHM